MPQADIGSLYLVSQWPRQAPRAPACACDRVASVRLISTLGKWSKMTCSLYAKRHPTAPIGCYKLAWISAIIAGRNLLASTIAASD